MTQKVHSYPVGTVRQWKGGHFRKEEDGSWKPIPYGAPVEAGAVHGRGVMAERERAGQVNLFGMREEPAVPATRAAAVAARDTHESARVRAQALLQRHSDLFERSYQRSLQTKHPDDEAALDRLGVAEGGLLDANVAGHERFGTPKALHDILDHAEKVMDHEEQRIAAPVVPATPVAGPRTPTEVQAAINAHTFGVGGGSEAERKAIMGAKAAMQLYKRGKNPDHLDAAKRWLRVAGEAKGAPARPEAEMHKEYQQILKEMRTVDDSKTDRLRQKAKLLLSEMASAGYGDPRPPHPQGLPDTYGFKYRAGEAVPGDSGPAPEIGRASCRERVSSPV